MKSAVSTPTAPKAVGPYSQAVRAGGLLFVAGQIPLNAAGQMIEGSCDVQAQQVLENIGAILAAAGLSFADVVRTTVYLADLNDMAVMNEVYGRYFFEPFPARATIQVARLPRDVKIEIEAIAAYDEKDSQLASR